MVQGGVDLVVTCEVRVLGSWREQRGQLPVWVLLFVRGAADARDS